MDAGILQFDEGYFERIWGGRKLDTVYGKPIPPGKPVGEAWLLSDHEQHVSAVARGSLRGESVNQLMHAEPNALLGEGAVPTVHGQFPLLLKILDAADYLSVQVHPNDEDAARLGEPDVGKTEMWYVLDAEPGAELICGMPPELTRNQFEESIRAGSLGDVLTRFPVEKGTVVFVPAGTVHAIGPGVVIAEIQQNSNVTYRVYDWDRMQADGNPRELHIEKSLEVTRFGSRHSGATSPLEYVDGNAHVSVLAACRYFTARRVRLEAATTFDCPSFRIVFALTKSLELEGGGTRCVLAPGESALIPAACGRYRIESEAGPGEFLEYFVPNLARDIVHPLKEMGGHDSDAIAALGGDPATSDLTPLV